jgi:hypoxanthine phosphoribosyltransferase
MGVTRVLTDDIAEVLWSEDDIAARIRELGREISADYAGKDLVLVGILNGAFVFLSDLMKSISIPVSVDFVMVSSYGDSTESSGVVKVLKSVEESVANRHVLLVEDIVDTGRTLSACTLIDDLYSAGAESVRICALLDKPERRVTDIRIDYVGFEAPNKFVVGYGLDFQGLYRNLPFVGVLKEDLPLNR